MAGAVEGERGPEKGAAAPHRGTSFARNVAWNLALQFWSPLLAVVTTPYVIARLGTDAYGVLLTAGVLSNYLWFMDLGVGQATVKYVAEHAARGEWEEVSEVLRAATGAYAVLGAIAAAVLAALAPAAAGSWFQVPPALQEPAVRMFLFGAATFFVGMVNNVPAAVPRALERFDVVSRIGAAAGLLQTLLTVAVLAAGYSAVEVMAAQLLLALAILAVNVRVARSLLPSLPRARCRAATLRRILVYGGYSSAHVGLGSLLENSDKLLIGSLRGVGVLPFYSVPYNLVSRSWSVPRSVFNVLVPRFSSLQGEERWSEIGSLYVTAVRWTAALTIPIAATFVVYGPDLLSLWLNPDFGREGGPVIRLLGAATLLWCVTWPAYALLQGVGHPERVVHAQLAVTVLYLPGAWWLVREQGLAGAALAWLLRACAEGALVMLFSRRAVPWSMAELGRCLARAAAVTGVTLGLLLSARWSLAAGGQAVLFAALLVGTAGACVAMVYHSLLEPAERARLAASVRWGSRLRPEVAP